MDQTTSTDHISFDKDGDPAPPPPVTFPPPAPSPAAALHATPSPGIAYPASTSGSRFRLRRSRTDRMLGGVCGGLAESLGVDVTLLRIGLVALTVLGAGFGAVLYVAAWVLAPEADAPV